MLRKLESKDAPSMLKWMHNTDIVKLLPTNFMKYSLEDCSRFISNARYDETVINLHFAVVNSRDEYVGTISLKNIDRVNQNAEYAIVLGEEAIGKGYALPATNSILDIAFRQLKLKKVYLCVFEENKRAIRFYEKYKFVKEGNFRSHILDYRGIYHNLLWYGLLDCEYEICMK